MASLMLAAILMCLISSSSAYDFYVGGRAGWVENPGESYNNWASRMRVQVNDKLVFKFKKIGDSVLLVKKEDYDSCNVNNPIQKLEGGDSASFQFNRSGPFYFISGTQDQCSKGLKMVVVVMAVRGKKPSPTPPLQPPTSSPSPSLTPLQPPTSSPSPSLSPSPSSTMAPTPSPSASPTTTPTPSPSSTMAPTPSPPVSPSTAPTTPSSTVSPPAPGPSSSNGGGGGVPAGNESSPPSKSSCSALTASIGTVALVLAHAFLGG